MAVVDTDERAPQLRSALFYHLFSILVWCHMHLTKCEKIKQMKTAPLQKSGWLLPFVPCQLINHSSAPTPETPFNHYARKKKQHCLLTKQPKPPQLPSISPGFYWQVAGTVKYFISTWDSSLESFLSNVSRLKAAINPLGLSLMIPTWEHFTASLS